MSKQPFTGAYTIKAMQAPMGESIRAEPERITLAQFIEQHSITASSARVDRNPNATPGDPGQSWENSAHHWRVELRRAGKRMAIYFSKGSGHHGEPATVAEVLDCLASDSAGIENTRDFADWCSEYGYEPDSRKAHRTYTICRRQAERLQKFLGQDAYEQLLWHTERQ